MGMNRNQTAPKVLFPGSGRLSDRVRAALRQEDQRHCESELVALQTEICEGLVKIYPQAARNFTAVLLAGSGADAVEAMIASLVSEAGKPLVVVNGPYGERMIEMLQAQGKQPLVVSSDWTAPMNLEAVEKALDEEGDITHVLATHLETAVGRLNDLPALGAICRRRGVPLLLNAVSSFCAEEIDFEGWNLEACAGTASNCLQGSPGVSFVLARRAALEIGRRDSTIAHMDLFRLYAEQRDGSALSSLPANVCCAMVEAMRELADNGGWRARRVRYATLSRRVFDGLRELGVEPLLDLDQPSSSVLTAYRIPSEYDCARLFDQLKSAGFVIQSGKEPIDPGIFRVAVTGAIGSNDVARLLACFRQFLTRRSEKSEPARPKPQGSRSIDEVRA
jgi:2-aminoethylphosphonate-pyruvate transaminase